VIEAARGRILKAQVTKQQLILYPHIIFLMSSQQSNDRTTRSNRPLSQIAFHARQLLRVNTQRAANWFKKPFPRFKLKPGFISSSSRSNPSPYSHSSTTNDVSHSIQSSSTTLYSITPTAPQTTSTYNTRRLVRSSPLIVPIMPTARLFLYTVCLSSRLTIMFRLFSSGSK
jgi:hypothetical protein